MDHSSAHLIEFSLNPVRTKSITSKFNHQEKEHSLSKSENLMHNKEQHEQAQYYKQLGDEIKKYTDVLLFGPTEAKKELYNILKVDPVFEKIKIEILAADKMTQNQQYAFVRAYFLKS